MNAVNLTKQTFTPGIWAFAARVMQPVIRIFLRMGFSAEQISQLVRKLAVDAAMEHDEFRAPNRKRAFIAHAAVLTGLSRKEVAKLQGIEELADVMDTRQVDRSVRVLAGWINDARYREPMGESSDESTGESSGNRPRTKLPLKAASGVSFHQLVREYGGDVPARSVLDALIQRGAVTRQGKSVELVQDYPTQAGDKDEAMEFIGIMLRDVLDTAEYDLRPQTRSPRLFREWYQRYIPLEHVPDAQAVVREETMAFGRKLEERLATFAHRCPKANTEYRRLGLGAYYFETETDRK